MQPDLRLLNFYFHQQWHVLLTQALVTHFDFTSFLPRPSLVLGHSALYVAPVCFNNAYCGGESVSDKLWAMLFWISSRPLLFTARVFLVEISLLFLEITGHLLVIYVYITVWAKTILVCTPKLPLRHFIP